MLYKFSDNSNPVKNPKIQLKNSQKPLKNKHNPELTLKLFSCKEIIYKITLKNYSIKSRNIQ